MREYCANLKPIALRRNLLHTFTLKNSLRLQQYYSKFPLKMLHDDLSCHKLKIYDKT